MRRNEFGAFALCHACRLRHVGVVSEFFDVLNQAEEQPLPIDLVASAIRKAIKSFVSAEVAEHRFDGSEAPSVLDFTVVTVESLLHALYEFIGFGDGFVVEERDLARDGFVRLL